MYFYKFQDTMKQKVRIPFTCIIILLMSVLDVSAQVQQNHPSVYPAQTFTDTSVVRLFISKAHASMGEKKHDLANKYMDLALLASRYFHNKDAEAEALLSKGKIELAFNNRYDKATFLVYNSLAIYDSLGNHQGSADCNLQLGIISYDLQSYTESIQYFNKALELTKNISKLRATAHYLTALAYSELDNFVLAISMFDTAMTEYRFMQNKEGELWCKVFIGKMFSNTGDHKKAITYFQHLINAPEYKTDRLSLMPAYAFLATAYLKEKNYEQAIHYGLDAYRLGNTQMGTTYYLKEAYSSLQNAYNHIGNVKEAYFFLNKLNILKDSIYSNNILQGIGKMKSQYAYEQQINIKKIEQEKKDLIVKEELNKQKLIRNGSLVGLTFVLLFALILHNQRNKIKQGKELSDKLLLNILPSEVAEELKTKGYAEAKQFDEVTVMFTDFKSFTLISERLSPAELVTELDTCFKAFDEIITRHGIEKIKTIGDSYMCAGGIPTKSQTHASDVVKAAIEIQDFAQKLMLKRKDENKEYFEIRIGIHTGPVVAGIVGVKKFAYDIWGDTVNIASRMEASGEPGKINISESTYLLVKDQFDCKHRGKVKAKHKGEIDMYFVNHSFSEG
jgi:adenylate cyclase